MAGGDSQANLINSLRGSIYAGVQERETSAQLWSRIRGDLGLPDTGPTGVALQTFNSIWHEAVSARNARDQFSRALAASDALGLDQAITNRMIADTAYSRPLAERNLAPLFQVNFQMEMTDASGNRDIGWFTVMHRGALPSTVQALQSSVNLDAEMMAGRYGKAFVSAGSITILAV